MKQVAAAVQLPLILASGLNANNVGSAITEVRPHAVDVLSSMEDKRHRKVREHVHGFVRAVRDVPDDLLQ